MIARPGPDDHPWAKMLCNEGPSKYRDQPSDIVSTFVGKTTCAAIQNRQFTCPLMNERLRVSSDSEAPNRAGSLVHNYGLNLGSRASCHLAPWDRQVNFLFLRERFEQQSFSRLTLSVYAISVTFEQDIPLHVLESEGAEIRQRSSTRVGCTVQCSIFSEHGNINASATHVSVFRFKRRECSESPTRFFTWDGI